ncbi:MAG TPA: NUDIX hydrolase [Gaiellaceae bacterium]|nr:NUDIX hydrolase [Gaiellaceae bacterium]
MLQLAADLAEPFSRNELPGHFTASAAVVDEGGRRICLVDHAKLGRRLQPGGHIEPGDESAAAAALRETREETGLEPRLHPFAPRPFDVDIHEFPERDGEPAHLHLDLRFLLVAGGEPGDGAAWVPFDEALAATDEPAFRRLIEKARRFVEPRD